MNLFANSENEGSADRDESTPVEPDQYWRDQCVLYLLDELDEQSTSAFVQRLEESAPLNQYLAEQAELIATLTADPVMASAPVQSTTSQTRWNGMLAAMIALAATVLVVFSFQRGSNESLEQETIALAWVDSQSINESVSSTESSDDLLDEFELTLVASQTETQIDETLDWMYAALAMESDADTGESNDG